MNNSQVKTKYTLEEIVQRKKDVLQNIRAQHDIIERTAHEAIAPFAPSSGGFKSYSLIKGFNRGLIVFDGVLLGFKIMKSFRKLFKKKF